MRGNNNNLTLHCPAPSHILVALLFVISLLVIAGIVSNRKIFDLDREGNIPTWFSSLLLFMNAILLGLIAWAKTVKHNRWRWHWGILSFIFVMLSIDESVSIHEKSIGPLRDAISISDGVLYYAWVVPAAILLLCFSIVYFRFVWMLPRRTGGLFVLAFLIYISGAIGFEMIGGAYVSQAQYDQIYRLITICEETLEMIGLAIFFYALTDYIRSNLSSLILRFRT